MGTQKDFSQAILALAIASPKHIVLPEGRDERTIVAAKRIINEKISPLTILGNAEQVASAVKAAGINSSDLQIIDPNTSNKTAEYAQSFYELRKTKGMTIEKAAEIVKDVMYFGMMMVKAGDADGLVSGAVHSTADTIRPALQIIKAAASVKTVSSMFFMTDTQRTLLFSDCGLNQNPTAEQLVDIVLSTAKTAKQFGIVPKIAMLSYSTKGSAGGADAEKMVKATALAKERLEKDFDGEYVIDGELQFDSAFVPDIAAKKCPLSPLKGNANTFIFPDLGVGNICYKMAERLAGLNAYGPILQGLAKPVNDLSRGCNSDDIVATAAITAIQAK
ncbi:MAG: phosphate acetyltransferase [Anaerohalosphaeraceae bacterium]|nr:phosphate acetyltransferase [Anaerohalosphaeraceae bacterium]